jgi:hypothetical protein
LTNEPPASWQAAGAVGWRLVVRRSSAACSPLPDM